MTHSFVVRIWLEEIADDPGRVSWRGHVTHVPDRARCYFDDLSGPSLFIASYLRGMGVRFNWVWRLKLWAWHCKTGPG